MQENNISPTPIYWDGESPIFHSDTTGTVHIFRECGYDAERIYDERQEANNA